MDVFQSPIALSFKEINFTDSSSKLKYERRILKYNFDTNTKEWKIASSSPILKTNQSTFQLVEFHFHQPGEHTLNKKRFVLETHFVFASTSGHLLVLGFLANLSNHSSKLFKNIQNNEPTKIPTMKDYWSYTGSLTGQQPIQNTTNVNWFVSRNPLHISQSLLNYFIQQNQTKISRPIQDRAGRSIFFTSSS